MRVCIVRNAEVRTNAGMIRIIDALVGLGIVPITLTRSRFSESKKGRFINSPFSYQGHLISNYELQSKVELGGGIKNLLNLILYQLSIVFWLIKHREKYDIIHAFDLDTGIPSLICSKIFKKKIIYHVADFYIDSRHGIPQKLKNFIKKIEFYVISKSDVTIICTEERKEQIKHSNPKKLYVIHNSPVENEYEKQIIFDKALSSNPALLTLGYVGGLSETRFIDKIINIVKNNLNVKLEIAGFGKLENVVKKAAENYPNISYHGRISYVEALNLYSQCDVMFAMYDPDVPNHKYSAPNKVYEAMMLGKPIIVAKGTSIDKLVDKEGIGISVEYNELEFSKTLSYLLKNQDLVKQMGENSRNSYINYSWKKNKHTVQGIYKSLR